MDEQWTHAQMREYLEGEKVREKRQAWGVGRGLVDVLLDLVDQLKDEVGYSHKIQSTEIRVSFEEVEDLISNLMSGAATPEMKQGFLNNLYQSADFYHRVILKMDQLIPVVEKKRIPELNNIAMKSDNEILLQLGVANGLSAQKRIEKGVENKFKDILEKLFGWLEPVPRYVVVLALIFFIVVPGLLIVYEAMNRDHQEDIFAEFDYTKTVPYEYTSRSFRGLQDPNVHDYLIDSFSYQFKVAMSDYVIFNYKETILGLEKMEPMVRELENSEKQQAFEGIREYYFYLGMSYLAMSRTQISYNDNNDHYLNQAINMIMKSFSIAENHKLNDINRENYYLSLTHAMIGNIKQAELYCNKIKSNSAFKERCNELFSILNKDKD
jgi:hypothetical protein